MGNTARDFYRFYSVWGWVLLVVPVALCSVWVVVTMGADSPRQAKEWFEASYCVFSYYDTTWLVSAVMAAVAFFFASRLVGRGRDYRVNGVFMLVVSGVSLVLSIGHLLIK